MILVAIASYGSLNMNFYVASRSVLAAARQGHMPRLLSLIHKRIKSPMPALAITGMISTLMLIPKASDLNALVNLFCQAAWIMYGLSLLGVFVLRVRKPNVNRPFKVFIVLPIIMALFSATLVIVPFFQDASYPLFCFVSSCVVFPFT